MSFAILMDDIQSVVLDKFQFEVRYKFFVFAHLEFALHQVSEAMNNIDEKILEWLCIS